jgi:hypothetical protein
MIADLKDYIDTTVVTVTIGAAASCVNTYLIYLARREQRQTKSQLTTGNGHTVGEGVARLERRLKALTRLLAVHMRASNDLVKSQRDHEGDAEVETAMQRYLDRQGDALMAAEIDEKEDR